MNISRKGAKKRKGAKSELNSGPLASLRFFAPHVRGETSLTGMCIR
jgi:hypothetical protein